MMKTSIFLDNQERSPMGAVRPRFADALKIFLPLIRLQE